MIENRKSYNPAMESREVNNPGKDSNRIEEASASVYALCSGSKNNIVQQDKRLITLLQAVVHHLTMTGIKSAQEKQLLELFLTFNKWFTRRFAALLIYLFLFSLIQPEAAFALERIQFDPCAATPALPSVKSPTILPGLSGADAKTATQQGKAGTGTEKARTAAVQTGAPAVQAGASANRVGTWSAGEFTGTSSKHNNDNANIPAPATSREMAAPATSRGLAAPATLRAPLYQPAPPVISGNEKVVAPVSNQVPAKPAQDLNPTPARQLATPGAAQTSRFSPTNQATTAGPDLPHASSSSATKQTSSPGLIRASSPLATRQANTSGLTPSSSFSPATQGATPAYLPAKQAAPAPAPNYVKVRAQDATTDRQLIRIGLNSGTNTAEIIVPDGAQIIDESNQRVLAELPCQSRWQVTIENATSGKRLALSGTIPQTGSARVLVAAGIIDADATPGKHRVKKSSKHSFAGAVQTIESRNPKLFLQVKPPTLLTSADRQYAPRSAAGKQYDSRPSTDRRNDSFIAPQQSAHRSVSTAPASGTPPLVVSGYIIKPNGSDGVTAFDGKVYRGSVVLKPRTGEALSFVVINLLDVEDYLLSVVPAEMPPKWNLEALKAQSIAARSYALANMGKHQSEGYDLKASSEDQDYRGVQTEADSSNRAVAETKGLVITHQGKVVTAYFHSSGGGFTEQAENVFGGKLPYLKSVPDFDDQSPHFNWMRCIPVLLIEENLKKQGREIGGLLGIFAVERSVSQRVTSAMLAGTLQTIMLSGEELRKLLALPSTVFNIGAGPESYLVSGRGFGHGLGMSQWGAKALSEQGYNASQILSYYYKDVTVEQF